MLIARFLVAVTSLVNAIQLFFVNRDIRYHENRRRMYEKLLPKLRSEAGKSESAAEDLQCVREDMADIDRSLERLRDERSKLESAQLLLIRS